MWKQSTIFAFVAGTMISLALQSLMALGLFEVKQGPATTVPSLSVSDSTLPVDGSEVVPSTPFDIGDKFGQHLKFDPFVLASAIFFFVSGSFLFFLANLSQSITSEISSLASSEMEHKEKLEIERAVVSRHGSRLRSHLAVGIMLGVLGFVALLFRL